MSLNKMLGKTYKIFCVYCEWEIQRDNDSCLWNDFAQCPMCDGGTDAVEIKNG